jgi:cyclopropane fatty-acyl-phospholipid synthase-like methyltransferase
MNKPFSQSCENNKVPILQIISELFSDSKEVWEIGSGTGQHACYFAQQLPHLSWQATDRAENMTGINAWLNEAGLDNTRPALALDVMDEVWPCQQIDAVFSANTLHSMPWQAVQAFFQGLERYLTQPQALVCIYGPFNYQGKFTTASNAQFDQWLKNTDPERGIRDFEDIEVLARKAGLLVKDDFSMPANNRLLVLQNNNNKNKML